MTTEKSENLRLHARMKQMQLWWHSRYNSQGWFSSSNELATPATYLQFLFHNL